MFRSRRQVIANINHIATHRLIPEWVYSNWYAVLASPFPLVDGSPLDVEDDEDKDGSESEPEIVDARIVGPTLRPRKGKSAVRNLSSSRAETPEVLSSSLVKGTGVQRMSVFDDDFWLPSDDDSNDPPSILDVLRKSKGESSHKPAETGRKRRFSSANFSDDDDSHAKGMLSLPLKITGI